jgi:hypothetical protein
MKFTTSAVVLPLLLGTVSVVALGARASAPAAEPFPPIVIASAVPSDIAPGGAQSASLQQAAAFAWQEFIALNWPAVPQNGAVGQREQPEPLCFFAAPACGAQQRVWETFRGKVEIFPGDASPPPGYVNNAAASYGYDALPQYRYGSLAGSVSPCTGTPPPRAAWINLDETDQITLDSMYAGTGPTSVAGNSDPQLVRFLAKANRVEYVYVARHPGWWAYDAPVGPPNLPGSTGQYVVQHGGDPPPNSDTYVSFPNGTIEVKAGWRVLGPGDDATRFHTNTVRYYEPSSPGAQTACYRETTFGLVSLHIIQKTPTAPYFVYATFEQADNIRNAAGTPIENDDGSPRTGVAVCPQDQQQPCPTTPLETLLDAATPAPGSSLPPQVVVEPSSAPYCTSALSVRPKNQLYYLDEPPAAPQQSGLPTGGFVCVNERANPIPSQIVAVNDNAQQAIAAYARQHGFDAGPWTHYKLVNVQYQPIDKASPGPYPGNDPNTGMNPSSYYLANIVVETDRPLQLFSGGLLGTNVNSDYASQFGGTPPPLTHKNTYYGGSGHDMGGCMGCHGSQGQTQGGDFSVIMARGPVGAPEIPHSAAIAAQVRHLLGATAPAPALRNRRIVPDIAPPVAH